MVVRSELNKYLNSLLDVSNFKDYCPNGLQIEGKNEVKKIITGVTACQELIDLAILEKADAIIVHHGLFWQGDQYPLVGINKKRIKALLENDINLWAYHLPLDCHKTLGNNAQLAKLFELTDLQSFAVKGVDNLLWQAKLQKPQTAQQIQKQLAISLNRAPLYLGVDPIREINSIAWCSGAAQKYIVEAKELGADLYFSGEVSEQTMHLAKELGIHYLACGHHATESLGIQELAKDLQEKYSIEHKFIDIHNPV